MNLRENIDEKYKSAIKSKSVIEINTLRLIKSAIKNKDIENRTSSKKENIDDNEILKLLQSLIKQRNDSIDAFKLAFRNDLIDQETNEIEIITQFLPKQLSLDETKQILEKFFSDNNITSIKDMGKIMIFLKTNYVGKVDMSQASKIVKELLDNQ